jgi:predicted benzoate:H+ symporter BenE
MSRWPHLIFCAIWIATAVVFVRQAVDSYAATHISLARFQVHFPSWGSVSIMGVDVPKTMTAMADTNNANVAALEQSIRASASLTLRLNAFSAFMALVGLVAQIGAYRYDSRQRDDRDTAVQGDG